MCGDISKKIMNQERNQVLRNVVICATDGNGEIIRLNSLHEVTMSVEQSDKDYTDIDNFINTKEYEFSFTLNHLDPDDYLRLCYGIQISNNYRRMHGGFPLRRYTRYRRYKKNRVKSNKYGGGDL